MSVRWTIKTGIFLVLLVVLSPPVAAIGESVIPSLLIAIDVAQEKSLVTVNVDDAIMIADNYAEQGDYERAVNIYGLAEEQWVRDHPYNIDRDSNYYFRLASMEKKRGEAYYNWGHYEEAAVAQKNTDRAFDRGYAKEHEEEESSGSGCLIVTATFGSPLASEVRLVRDYRDGSIRQSYSGSRFFMGFNAWYYTFSPAVSGYIATHPVAKSVMQICLVPLLWIILLSENLHAALGFSPEVASVSVLLFGAAAYGLVYILPPVSLMVWLAGRKGWKVPAPKRVRPFVVLWILLITGLAAGIFLSLDFLTIAASGLLVACTIALVAGTGSLTLIQYLKRKSDLMHL